MIEIDTKAIKELSNACASANNEITNAVSMLTNITNHDDWGCREKDRINEYTSTNKQKILQLQECSASFTNNLRQVADEFERLEKEISDRFSDVDQSVGGVISTTSWQPNIFDKILSSGSVVNSAREAIQSAITSPISGPISDIVRVFGKGVSGQTGHLPVPTGKSNLGAFLSKGMDDNISMCSFSDVKL